MIATSIDRRAAPLSASRSGLNELPPAPVEDMPERIVPRLDGYVVEGAMEPEAGDGVPGFMKRGREHLGIAIH
jgi:hypothetical protein